jgi:hypothetical protein
MATDWPLTQNEVYALTPLKAEDEIHAMQSCHVCSIRQSGSGVDANL